MGGLAFPLAHQRNTLFGRVHSIEVLINVGAVCAGQGVIDAIMVLPGQLSAYRRELTRLGGFASGINGEDTELTVRVGRAGYRVIMDPDIRPYSEVLHSISHLREQRIRWSRSLMHVYKCHISALWYLQGWRGVWLLPFGLLSSVRRALLPLFILFALVSLVVAPDQLFIRDGIAVIAVIGGPHLILVGAPSPGTGGWTSSRSPPDTSRCGSSAPTWRWRRSCRCDIAPWWERSSRPRSPATSPRVGQRRRRSQSQPASLSSHF